jgi:perosamine synthetase
MIIGATKTLRDAVELINENAQGIVFIVREKRKLAGVLTDGDIRRYLLAGGTLDIPVRDIMKQGFVACPVETPAEELASLLSDRIRHIPLIDDQGCVVDYACRHHLRRIPVMEPFLGGNELAYVIDCIKTNWISSQGKYVTEFERKLAEILGASNASAVSSGTAALHLALLTLEIGPGDEVIVPDLTFAASANTVIHTGGSPVFVDVSPHTWTMDPDEIEKAITPRTKAIMAVHLYGHPCDMDPIMAIARKHDLLVIEDCAEALGAAYKGSPVGLIGDAGCFSFFGNKLITTGEGGMVLFKESKHAERVKIFRDHGMSADKRYWHVEVGYNYRMTNLQAAVGVAQLERFDLILDRKLTLVELYEKAFASCSGITLPPKTPWARNIFWLYTILIDEGDYGSRDDVIRKFLLNGIETRPVFYPIHQMPPYSRFAKGCSFPNSEAISKKGLSLPSSGSVTQAQVDSISETLAQIRELRQIRGAVACIAG